MKLRKSNRGKSFRAPEYFSQFDESGDEELGTEKIIDEGFVDEGILDDDEDEYGRDDQPDVDAISESEGPGNEDDDNIRKVRSSKSAARQSSQHKSTRAEGKVQPYPTESSAKWTRSYVGGLQRWSRLHDLAPKYFGERDDLQHVVDCFNSLWGADRDYRPMRLVTNESKRMAENPWMPQGFGQDQLNKFRIWYTNYHAKCSQPQMSLPLSKSAAFQRYLPQAGKDLTALLGPYRSQKEYNFTQGQSMTLATGDVPLEEIEDDSQRHNGWLLDVGGITLSMGWAPRKDEVDQFLAMAVIPFSEQAYYETPEQAPADTNLKQGSIQIWRVSVEKDANGIMCFAKFRPKLVSALCFEWGRAVRMQWCPVQLTSHDQVGLLAMLSSDSKVRVVEIEQLSTDGTNESFKEILEPIATLELKDEYRVEITCFTWTNMNRIAVGHSDGSVAVWSIYPCRMLQRHPVHSSSVIDISSGYPSNPFIVATVPVGGVATVTDLNRPNGEFTYCANPLVNFQGNLLSWSEHLQAYILIWPSSSPANVSIGFQALRVFSQARLVMALGGQPTCLAVAACHPFLLAGSTDGSLYLVNVYKKVLFYRKKSYKLRLFQHELISSAPFGAPSEKHDRRTDRGICRILQGFRLENNGQAKSAFNAQARNKPIANGNKTQGKAKSKKGSNKNEISAAEVDMDGEATTGEIVVNDPLARITAVAWNPNVEFSWWAAAAMGSGLVRIMDVGMDALRGHREHPGNNSTGEGNVTMVETNGDDEEAGRREASEDISDDEEAADMDDEEGEGRAGSDDRMDIDDTM